MRRAGDGKTRAIIRKIKCFGYNSLEFAILLVWIFSKRYIISTRVWLPHIPNTPPRSFVTNQYRMYSNLSYIAILLLVSIGRVASKDNQGPVTCGSVFKLHHKDTVSSVNHTTHAIPIINISFLIRERTSTHMQWLGDPVRANSPLQWLAKLAIKGHCGYLKNPQPPVKYVN